MQVFEANSLWTCKCDRTNTSHDTPDRYLVVHWKEIRSTGPLVYQLHSSACCICSWTDSLCSHSCHTSSSLPVPFDLINNKCQYANLKDLLHKPQRETYWRFCLSFHTAATIRFKGQWLRKQSQNLSK